MYQGVLSARGQWILFADADGATKFSDFTKLEKSALNAMKVRIKKKVLFLILYLLNLE
jgi:dolichyl-phosphate beta-glucosyltransferase